VDALRLYKSVTHPVSKPGDICFGTKSNRACKISSVGVDTGSTCFVAGGDDAVVLELSHLPRHGLQAHRQLLNRLPAGRLQDLHHIYSSEHTAGGGGVEGGRGSRLTICWQATTSICTAAAGKVAQVLVRESVMSTNQATL